MSVRTKEEVGQPGGIFASHVDDGEIEHVDHASVESAGIAAAIGEEGCDLRIGAFAEDTSIEHAVNDVAYSARSDEGNAKQHAEFGLFLRKAYQHPEKGHDGHNPKEAERQFPQAAIAQPSECHAVILDKQQLEPTSDDGNLVTEGHMGLHPNLENLVQQ